MATKTLKPDGAYGNPVNGYTSHNQTLKSQFLRNARALLREAGKQLAAYGLTAMEVSVNPAGPAVSGDVSASYWRPDDPACRVYTNISGSALGWGRQDSIIILAQVQFYRADAQQARKGKVTWHMHVSGPNQWLSANFDSQEIAGRLWQIFQPETSPSAMTAFTSHGEQVIPDPVVANDEEAVAWAVGMRATDQTFAKDNESALAAEPAPIPVTLTLFNEIEDREDVPLEVAGEATSGGESRRVEVINGQHS